MLVLVYVYVNGEIDNAFNICCRGGDSSGAIWLIKSLARKKYMSSNAKALLAIGFHYNYQYGKLYQPEERNIK